MKIDGRGTGRRKAGATTPAWVYRFGVAACLAAFALAGRPALQAQGVPAKRPSALEQLRAAVGIAPAGDTVAPSPQQGKDAPTRLDRVARRIDALALLNGAAPPILPVAALAPAGGGVPAVLEMPVPAAAEGATGAPAPVPAVAPPARSWKVAGVTACVVLIGTALLLSVFLVSRRAGLTVRLRISLGEGVPRA